MPGERPASAGGPISMGEPELAKVQRWLFSYIVAPGSRGQALEAANLASGFAGDSAAALIIPSHSLSPLERISIYRNMYLLRMEEALEIDYPALQHRLGGKRFFALVSEYVKVYPSRSWTLNHLGARLVDFLRETDLYGPRLQAQLVDLARLEWALCQVFDAPEGSVLDSDGLAELAPEQFEFIRLRPVAALRTLVLDYPAHQYLDALDEDRDPPNLKKRSTRLAVWRYRYSLRRRELSAPAYELLDGLTRGMRLGEAIDLTLRHRRVSQTEISGWFSRWISEGFFSGYEL